MLNQMKRIVTNSQVHSVLHLLIQNCFILEVYTILRFYGNKHQLVTQCYSVTKQLKYRLCRESGIKSDYVLTVSKRNLE